MHLSLFTTFPPIFFFAHPVFLTILLHRLERGYSRRCLYLVLMHTTLLLLYTKNADKFLPASLGACINFPLSPDCFSLTFCCLYFEMHEDLKSWPSYTYKEASVKINVKRFLIWILFCVEDCCYTMIAQYTRLVLNSCRPSMYILRNSFCL